MHQIRPGETGLRPLLEGRQPLIGFLVEIEDRTGTHRYVHLILEVIPYSIVWNQLVL